MNVSEWRTKIVRMLRDHLEQIVFLNIWKID